MCLAQPQVAVPHNGIAAVRCVCSPGPAIPRVKRRTQASIAVSADSKSWCLLNCSPDIREQIGSVDALHPRDSLRDSPVSDVVLTNADIDHIGGLLSLREGHRFTIHATEETLNVLKLNPVFDVLAARQGRQAPVGNQA